MGFGNINSSWTHTSKHKPSSSRFVNIFSPSDSISSSWVYILAIYEYFATCACCLLWEYIPTSCENIFPPPNLRDPLSLFFPPSIARKVAKCVSSIFTAIIFTYFHTNYHLLFLQLLFSHHSPHLWWKCWTYLSPLILFSTMLLGWDGYKRARGRSYKYYFVKIYLRAHTADNLCDPLFHNARGSRGGWGGSE